MSELETGSDRRRIEALENVVRALVAELETLRTEVAHLRGAPAPVPAPAPARASETWPEPVTRVPGAARAARPAPAASGDLEQLVGRYGTVVVATLALLLGLGAFLQWAIARGMLGPEVRLALGVVAALVLAVLGLRIRGKGSARYGNALLAIALAVVHLDAWAAGPGLALVPPALALAFAAVASLALAALAIREGDEFLFCLGLGGALLAPFVTMVGEGNTAQLLVFGAVVLAGAIVALRDVDWRVALPLVPIFTAWYMVTGSTVRAADVSPGSALWPATLALVLSLVALTFGARGVRRGLVGSLLFLVAVAIVADGDKVDASSWTAVASALFGTLAAHALRRRTAATQDGGPDSWYEVAGLPLLFLSGAVLVNDRIDTPEGAAVAAGWAGLTAVFLLVDGASQRTRHLAVMLTAAFIASFGLFAENSFAQVAAFATVAVLATFTLDRVRGAALLLPIALSLGFGTIRAFVLYSRRDAWLYTPFVNEAALAAATLVAAFVLLSWSAPGALASPSVKPGPWNTGETLTALRVAGPLAVFFWVRGELHEAFSADIATFLLISYYALTGVGTILVGRARAVSALRQTGLVLSLYAAYKAVMEASDVDRVLLKVGSYLVVGVFLLGVGYLYRARGTDAVSET